MKIESKSRVGLAEATSSTQKGISFGRRITRRRAERAAGRAGVQEVPDVCITLLSIEITPSSVFPTTGEKPSSHPALRSLGAEGLSGLERSRDPRPGPHARGMRLGWPSVRSNMRGSWWRPREPV